MVTGHIRRDEYAEYVRQLFSFDGEPNMQTARAITFQVTDDCTLRCSYCYEHHKACRGMNLETGRRIVDQLLDLYEKGVRISSIRTPGQLFWTSSVGSLYWRLR